MWGFFMFAKWAVLLAIFSAGLRCGALCCSAEAREAEVTCTNPASGAHWQIHIDYDKRLVDGSQAKIGDAEISWRDTSGNNYTLNRKSGEMTQITASSTGGYFLHDRCNPG
jgi:hypothetical protein